MREQRRRAAVTERMEVLYVIGSSVKVDSIELMSRLQFMSLFIAIYESFEDYILSCPRNFFDGSRMVSTNSSDYDKVCKEKKERQAKEKEAAQKHIHEKEASGNVIPETHNAYICANFDYKKITEDGWTKWLTPKYDMHIEKKLLTVSGVKQKKPSVLLNSLAFFGNITDADIEVFQAIKVKRNEFVHEMAKYLVVGVINTENEATFSNLVNLYIKVNNYWSVELECSIADDVPDNADYENIITTDLYNLLSVLDALIGSNFLGDRKYQPLYRTL